MSDPATTSPAGHTPPPSVSAKAIRKSEVGEVRPSQSLTTYGVGSLVDLPNLSVLVMGLEDWPVARTEEIGEERLMASVQRLLGGRVTKLRTPPRGPESFGGAQTNFFDESRTIGVPVAPFPRWLVCSACRLLAPISSSLFEPKVEPYRPDKTRYVHNCTTNRRSPVALPARFMAACPKGHLDDFPWVDFVHRNEQGCRYRLELYEVGASGEASDVEVRCTTCKKSRRMAEAFGRDNAVNMPPCKGRRPHLRDYDPHACDERHVRPILQGASNSWFPIIVSAMSVPQATDKLAQLVDDHWTALEATESHQNVTLLRKVGQLKEFVKHTDAEVWEAVERKRNGAGEQQQEATDLKTPEWRVFSNPASAQESKDFRLRAVDPPQGYEAYFERVVLVEKLREVRALVGFTRIESPRDFDSPDELPKEKRAPLSRQQPTWVPACETRGEGVFFQFRERTIHEWVARNTKADADFRSAHERWRANKNLDPSTGYPGLRYVLLHSFAHALIRQLSIECGYTTASVAERLYSHDGSDGERMAGVLIYTAAPDSEGTLGGLCALGDPKKLGRHLHQALDRVGLCASDPLCAEHLPSVDASLHAAACHACSFLPETSCERGNKYLDRSVLVATVEQRPGLAFFE